MPKSSLGAMEVDLGGKGHIDHFQPHKHDTRAYGPSAQAGSAS